MRPERRRTSPLPVVACCCAALFATSIGAGALAASAPTVGSATSSKLGETVLVSASGRTLYSLSGESARHLLCRSSECARFWPPLSVPSRVTKLKEGAGVHGTLGVIRRPNGTWQVTLRGKPLYRYSGDRAAGQVTGEGIHSFGGVWSAVPAGTAAPTPKPVPAPESTPPYGY